MIYIVFGLLWILLTDKVLLTFAPSVTAYIHLETIKGFTFVFLSAALIHGLSSLNNRRIKRLHKELVSNYSALINTHRDLNHQKHLVEEIFNSSNSLILVWSLSGEVINMNRRFSEVFGYGDEIIGENWPALLVPASETHRIQSLINELRVNHEALDTENIIVGKNGREFTIQWNNAIIDDPFNERLIAVSFGTDITSEREKDQAIDKLIFNDTLTSLGSRQSFENDLNKFIEYNMPFTVYIMGIDNFRAINEIYGHKIGDSYLQRISNAFLKLPNCKTYRFSGDEFVFLQGEPTSNTGIFVDRVLGILGKKRRIEKFVLSATGCIGATHFPEHGHDFETLVQNMTISLERAKSSGKNQWAEFDFAFKEQLTNQKCITDSIETAIESGSFTLNFQPIFRVHSRDIEKFEVLLRWPNIPVKSMHIGQVIALAEKTGQILIIDRWVIKKSFEFLNQNRKIWAAADKVLSINISAQTFHSDDFIDYLTECADFHDVDPKCIELEITEYSLIRDLKYSKKILDQLKGIGFKLSLDDFGTEYSSLNYLRQLPFDTLKIDKSYIDDITESKGVSHVIIEHVVHMAKAMSINTVAEGIEHEYQRAFLDDIHCEFGQGYLISRPLNGVDTLSLLKTHLESRLASA